MTVGQWALLLGGLCTAAPVSAQQDGSLEARARREEAYWNNSDWRSFEIDPPYDGRYDFVRLYYPGAVCMWEGPGWHHDYPSAERNLMRITADLTTVRPWIDSSAILSPADPALMKHPIAYLSEPGCWTPTEAEVKGLRTYLLKGGFMIVDDFKKQNWDNFATQMLRVLPEGRFVHIKPSDPVFKLFFDVSGELKGKAESEDDGGEFLGLYEDNDPSKRLLVVANYRQDIGEDWQWSADNPTSTEGSSNSFKFGVNYIIYGLTH